MRKSRPPQASHRQESHLAARRFIAPEGCRVPLFRKEDASISQLSRTVSPWQPTCSIFRLLFLASGVCSLLFAPAARADTQFYTESIPVPSESHPGGESIVLDAQGVVHVAIQAPGVPGWGIYYLTYSLTGWSEPEYVVAGNMPSIALDTAGRPHIACTGRPEDGRPLMYARKVGGIWVVETIDEPLASHNISLALDAQANPHLTYTKTGGDYANLWYARRYGGEWTMEVADPSGRVWAGFGGVRNQNSLALDSLGRPHVAYLRFEDTTGYIQITYATRLDQAWLLEHISITGVQDCSLALAGFDQPHIAFSAYPNEQLQYASRTPAGWNVETVDPGSYCAGAVLALDGDAAPHIGYSVWNGPRWGVWYAKRAEAGWEFQRFFTYGAVAFTLDERGQAHLVHDEQGQQQAPLHYTREVKPVEVVAASSDTTLYENGVDIVYLQVRTRRYFGPAGSVALSAELVPSIGPTYHAGDDAFFLDVGEEHVSELSWAVPDTAYPWEFDLKVSLEDGTGATRSPLTDRFFRNMFRAAKLPVTYLRQYFGLVVNCQQLDPETECLYQMAATVPVVGTSTAGVVLYYQNMCRAQEFMRRGDRCRAGMAFAQGMTIPGKLLVDALTGGVPSLIAKAKMLQSAGGAAMKCWQSEFAYDAHCGPRSGGALAGAGSGFVDSLASWMEAGIDSTETDVADALVVGSDCSVRVEADSAWVDADSLGLVFAHVMPFEEAGAVAMVTTQVHRLRGSKANNPHSASTFRMQSRAAHPLNLCLLHYDDEGQRSRLRYAEFSVTESTRLILNVRDDQAEFPLYVDFDGDGAIDEVHYPGGVVVGQDPVPTPVIRTELDLARPNPFNPTTTISFSISSPGQIALRIYDATGRLVARLLEDHLEAGRHEVVWDGRAENGTRLASGVYFCRLESGPVTITRQLVLLK